MKLAARPAVLCFSMLFGCFAHAFGDDLTPFAGYSGVYSRSLVTDNEDGNGWVCSQIIRFDLRVLPAISKLQFRFHSKARPGVSAKNQDGEVIVGPRSGTIDDSTITADREYRTIIEDRTVVRQIRLRYLGYVYPWRKDADVIRFAPDGTIRVGDCKFRRWTGAPTASRGDSE